MQVKAEPVPGVAFCICCLCLSFTNGRRCDHAADATHVLVQGHPEDQASFARCSGYVEQTGVRAASRLVPPAALCLVQLILVPGCHVSGEASAADIHSPATTVHEALLFSATLRLPEGVGPAAVRAFVREIERVVEVEDIVHNLVGMPGQSGLSVQQRKRLTIAVELAANPSIVFMDEPTTGQ